MPIRFTCHACRRQLSIGSHKAGSVVQCPGCRTTITVPGTGETAEPVDLAQFDFGEAGSSSAADQVSSAADSARDFNPDLVTISRRLLYAQGILIAVVGLLAFIAGYFVGAAGTQTVKTPAANPVQPAGPVRVTGKLSYQSAAGKVEGDGGSVIILLPTGKFPDERIPIEGLRPKDPLTEEDPTPVRAVESLGGAYLRADDGGKFELVVPKPGRYHVLLLSHHAERPRRMPPSTDDLSVLGKFFVPAAELLDKQKYSWQTIHMAEVQELNHDFGASGK